MPAYGEHTITDASFAQIDREIGAHGFTEAEYAIVRRVIHTTADFEFKQLIRFGGGPIEAAHWALQQGQPVVTDVSMVAAGIATVMAKTWQSPVAVAVHCADQEFSQRSAQVTPEKTLEKTPSVKVSQTRSADGMQVCALNHPGAIFAVGNAPTALLALCEGIAEGQWQPAVVIGTPVGFINVVESKQALAAISVPYILVAGRKGGSAVAAAILNALMIGAWGAIAMSPAVTPGASPAGIIPASAIHVVGVGLSGRASLPSSLLNVIESATLLIGAPRHLDAFSDLPIETWPLGNFTQVFEQLRLRLASDLKTQAVVLASGDPLFFGIGRLLLAAFPPERLVFHPQVSAIQLAFSRLKLPWQEATLLSVHGRGEERLVQALKRGDSKIAVLTDGVLTPAAIAQLLIALDLPISYRLWVCENLGAEHERLSVHWPGDLPGQIFASLNVVVLLRQQQAELDRLETRQSPQQANQQLAPLPLIGLPDSIFMSFPDRPTLMTKREIRLLVLGALAPLADQTVWDIGAGTGAVSIELSRLCPTARLYAIEKTAMGAALIRHNARKLAIAPIHTIQGQAPAALADLPSPDRVFIGGSGRQLVAILDFLNGQMATAPTASGRIVLALATLEHLSQVTAWLAQRAIANTWHSQLTQINISRSLPVGSLTRFSPLNPVTLVTLSLAPSKTNSP